METLTCENCSRKWKRELVRGRKPRLCPKCLTVPETPQRKPQRAIATVSANPARKAIKEMAKFPAPSNWKCPSCGASVSIKINIDHEPTHACKKRLSKVYALELVRI